MTSAEKLEVAKALARMGVDIIEAGFPAASPDDLEKRKEEAKVRFQRGLELVQNESWVPKRPSRSAPGRSAPPDGRAPPG